MTDDDELNSSLTRHTAALTQLDNLTKQFGRSVTDAFSRGVVDGKRFEDVLKSIATRLSDNALKQSLKPLEAGVTGLLAQGLQSLGGMFGGGGGPIQAFAKGGVVGSPTYFGTGDGLGLMGEAGAEAILPPARGPDGRLGVQSGRPAMQAAPVTINIAAADVESFRRSEGQVAAAVARAVARGHRTL